MATNAVGSYFHEFIGFENVIIPSLFVAKEDLPATNPPFSSTVLHEELTPLAKSTSSAAAVSAEQPYAHDPLHENFLALLAEEQIRLHRKKNQWLNQEDDWLAEFEKLALLELRK